MNTEHSHSHNQTDTHIHTPEHNHTQSHEEHALSSEERLALLSYMISHNKHHAEELHGIAHGLEGEAADLIHRAVDAFSEGNRLLEAAFACLQKGE